MKKKLAIILTGFIMISGAASKAFAATTPFEDVPADHWAYDAVAQLAADDVIEGYGDGTYRGDREITRFEMAQMVARAMAKGGGNKALLDKLAAEFADELNQLGVRVSALEKKVDNVIWKGQLRYRYLNEWEHDEDDSVRYTHSYVTLRLEPSMKVNEHWSGHARIDYNSNMKTAANTPAPNMTYEQRHLDSDIEYNGMRVERIWAEGNYGKLNIKLGKLPYTSKIDEGMMYDDNVSGGQITFGNKVKATLTAGRAKRFDGELGVDPDESRANEHGDTGSYQAVEIYNDRADKWTWGIAWHRWANKDVLWEDTDANHLNIYEAALGYKFNKNLRMHGAYSWTNDPSVDHDQYKGQPVDNPIFSHAKRSWSIELDYKKANPADKGSWGAFVAYRHLGHYSTIAPIYDTVYNGRRGVELGVSYVFLKNLMGTVKFFRGDKMPDDDSASPKPRDEMKRDSFFFTELNFFF